MRAAYIQARSEPNQPNFCPDEDAFTEFYESELFLPNLRLIGETCDEGDEGCGWEVSLPIPTDDGVSANAWTQIVGESRMKIKSVLQRGGNISAEFSLSPEPLGRINITNGKVHKALCGVAAECPLSIPTPATDQQSRTAMKDDKKYLPKLARWITAVLLRSDKHEFHQWQRTYMSLLAP
ncbi:MAG: hypothetical protein SGARI_000363, partial [Bacillariaceae sp.]